MRASLYGLVLFFVATQTPSTWGEDSFLCPTLFPGDVYRRAGLLGSSTPAADVVEALPAPAIGFSSALAPMTLGAEGDSLGPYLAARAGPLWFVEDLDNLDVGVNIEGAFGYRVLSLLALEIQSGYFHGEDTDGGGLRDLWGVPVVVNAKLVIPIFFLEVYAGLGGGGYYINTHAKLGGVNVDKDDFVFGGNAFVGAALALGPVEIGVEGKYIHTTDIDVANGSEPQLQAFTAMLALGLRF